MRLSMDQERLIQMLKESISLMCKNSLAYEAELNIEGLLGITLDKHEVLLVNINQSFMSEAWKQRQASNDLTSISVVNTSARTASHGLQMATSQPPPEPFSSRSEQVHMPHPVSLHQVSSVTAGMRIIKPEVSPAKQAVSQPSTAEVLEPGEEQCMLDDAISMLTGEKIQTQNDVTTSGRRTGRRRKTHSITYTDIPEVTDTVVIDGDVVEIKEENCSDLQDIDDLDYDPVADSDFSHSDRLEAPSEMGDMSIPNVSHDYNTSLEQLNKSEAFNTSTDSPANPKRSSRMRGRPRKYLHEENQKDVRSIQSNSERYRSWRTRLKSDPVRYERFLKIERERQKHRRIKTCISEKDREGGRLRQQKHREKLKRETGKTYKTPQHGQSKKRGCQKNKRDGEAQREYWRRKKAESRSKQSKEMQLLVKEYDRNRKRKKREADGQEFMDLEAQTHYNKYDTQQGEIGQINL